MNATALKGEIKGHGLNVEALAEMIGVDRATMYRKLNNFEKITIGEAQKIKDALGLTDERANEIFFG